MRYGTYLKELIDRANISKTAICQKLGISRPYLYSVFNGDAIPPTPEKQMMLIEILGASQEEASKLCDLAAQERGEIPADIAQFAENEDNKKKIREEYLYADPKNSTVKNFDEKKHGAATLKVPCCYQGGKQRVANEIIDVIFANSEEFNAETQFYDVCCGSGAYTVELLNRGIAPENITMIDISSWGVFWKAVCSGTFSVTKFSKMLDDIPADKNKIKQYMTELAKREIGDNECYLYPILQSCSFGGKQIWREGDSWKNAFFRNYWEPTPTSKRQSPANPMQPSPRTLLSRITALTDACQGITCLNTDVSELFHLDVPKNAVIYVDPPYQDTTGYAYNFDLNEFIERCRSAIKSPVFISEKTALTPNAWRLSFGGPKGGITGNKSGKHEEWLSRVN